MKNRFLQFSLLVSISLICASSSCAQTMEKLYEMSNKVYGKEDNSEAAMAQFYFDLADEVVQNLENKVRNRTAKDDDLALLRGLENALEPISKFKRFMNETDYGDDNRRRYFELIRDPANARNIFNALGQERVTQLIQTKMVHYISDRIKNSQLNAHEPFNMLCDNRFAAAIGLSESQVERIEKLTKEITKKLRVGPGKEFSDLENITRRHWAAIRQELEPEQRKRGNELIGEPAHWYRSVEDTWFRGDTGYPVVHVYHSDKIAELAKKLGKNWSRLTLKEVETAGIVGFYNHQIGFLKSPFSWDELEFSDSQRKQIIKDVKLPNSTGIYVVNSQEDVRLAEFLDGNPELPKYLEKHLNDQQKTWFKNMEFQILTRDCNTSFGILHPDVREHLNLSNSQVNAIKKASEEFAKQRELYEELLAKRRVEMLNEYNKDIAHILTDKQHELYTLYTGQSLETHEDE